ncbi:MAG: DUF3267 domain-containing protein [Candidatus Nezhaarchaeota archaeon]|nr:DUF3267 domain-containing protein [Candidatus Nezhaarchaeota archaeon]
MHYVARGLRLRTIVLLTLLALIAVLAVARAPAHAVLLGGLLFIPLAILHELTHYFTARRFNKKARIRLMLRYGALVLDYDKLTRNQCVTVGLMPLLVIEAPLVATWLLLSSSLLLVLALLHGAGSIVDVVYSLRLLTEASSRSTVSVLYDEGGRVAGAVVEDPSKPLTIVYLT